MMQQDYTYIKLLGRQVPAQIVEYLEGGASVRVIIKRNELSLEEARALGWHGNRKEKQFIISSAQIVG